MIKYRVLSKKEKALPVTQHQHQQQSTTVHSGYNRSQDWPNTQAYIDQVIVAAAANGFVVGAEVVRKSVPHLPVKIVFIEDRVGHVYGSAKPYFLQLENNQMLFNPDELILIESDKEAENLDFNLQLGASC